MKSPVLALSRLVLAFVVIALAPYAFGQGATQPPKLTLTTIAVPGAAVTFATGINTKGDIVGFFGQSLLGSFSGFLYSEGVFTYFDYPGQQVTEPGGINDSGLIVGLATQEAGQRSTVVGFLYDGISFTTLQDGRYAVTNAYGINNVGTVVGAAGPDVDLWAAFSEHDGKYTPVGLPGKGCPYKFANGINNLGEIVGQTSCGLYYKGYAVQNGKVHSVAFPGALETVPLGINDEGIVAGWYGKGALEYGFAYSHDKYVSFGYPGAPYTFAYGINGSGQIVGAYSFDNQTYYGFISSPIASADLDRSGCCRTAIVEGR